MFELSLRLDRDIALAAARLIPIESTHLVISQNLLPYLWESGVLGGRTYDVLMTRLPMEKLHDRLDQAYHKYPESHTLHDFRASDRLVEIENIALTKARNIITPHQEIAELFIHKVIRLDWSYPDVKPVNRANGPRILFPALSVGRKGAYEMRQLAQDMAAALVVTGKATEEERFWKGISIEYTNGDPLQNVGMVVFPTYVEHQPRILLKAIALGIPVITTTAAGIPAGDKVTIVPIGDYPALKAAVSLFMTAESNSHTTNIQRIVTTE